MIGKFYKYVSRNVAGMVGMSVYILADTFFISVAGGADGIVVLNLALPLYGLIFAIGSMIGIGSATRYSLLRAKGNEDTSGFLGQAVCWQLLASIPFVILGLFSAGTWLYFMGGDARIISLGTGYVRIVLLGTPFFMMNYSFTAFARNDNAPTIAMIAALTASTFNIIFDYVFVFPMGFGIAGAALATALAPLVSSLICSIHLFGKKSTVRFGREKIKSNLSVSKLFDCCKLGTSAFVGEISSAVITTVFNFLLLREAGNIGVAAYGIVANLSLVAMAIFNGISQGMQPLFSETFGKGEFIKVRKLLKHGVALTLITEMLLIASTWLFTSNLVKIFNSEGSELLAGYGYDALRLYFLGFLFAGVNIVLITYFSSIGQASFAMITSLLRGAVAIVICAILMSFIFGINGIWLSFPAAEFITFIVVVVLLRKVKLSF